MENQGNFKFLIVYFQRSNFPHTQLCIQLSVIVAKFYHIVHQSVLCCHFEAQFCFVMKQKVELPEVGSGLSNTPCLSNEVIKKNKHRL